MLHFLSTPSRARLKVPRASLSRYDLNYGELSINSLPSIAVSLQGSKIIYLVSNGLKFKYHINRPRLARYVLAIEKAQRESL